MRRFFISNAMSDGICGVGATFDIAGSDAQHISRVLRMREGDEILVCDMAKRQFICVIRDFSSETVTVEVKEIRSDCPDVDYKVTLYQALIKGDKMDSVVRHAVELGVDSIVPVLCERCVSTPDQAGLLKKIDRWQRIATEAAKQCGRGEVPTVEDGISFADMLSRMEGKEGAFLCYEGEEQKSIREVISDVSSPFSFFIGPEGGLSSGEVEAAHSRNIPTVGLGRLILRTETAGLAVLSMILYEKSL